MTSSRRPSRILTLLARRASARRRFATFLLAGACAALAETYSSGANAVTQPSGVTIPVLAAGVTTCADKNVQMCLDESEGAAGVIGAQADALIAPEAFQPTCRLTFQPIVKGGYNNAGFGWYNVKPDPANPGKFLKPLQTELFGMLFLNTHQQTGAELAGQQVSLDLNVERTAGRYVGGEIGFFLASGPYTFDAATHALTGTINELFFTQHALNPGSVTNPYLQVLTWQSERRPQSFYFGWEDQPSNAYSDNDFDDLVFLVSGIQCVGSGEACDTSMLGVCALGTRQCQKGEVVCVQSVQSSAEQCNALDDDCDGMVDDGDLCTEGKVCDRGRCVPKCGTAEFRCATGAVCNSRGVCVEAACAEKECPPGQVCQAGACVDGCSGVVCPHEQLCRGGGCVDPCQGVMCDEGYACVAGVCSSCECTACAGGKVCSKNMCVDTGCDAVSCAPGQHCSMGACADDCQGAICPQGQMCMAGGCVANPNAAPVGEDPPVGIDPLSGAGTLNGGVLGGGGSSGGSGGAPPASAAPGSVEASSGCGCRIPTRGSRAGALAALLAVALAARRRRSTARK